MDIVPAVRQKVAQNIGESRAKRAATADKVCITVLKTIIRVDRK